MTSSLHTILADLKPSDTTDFVPLTNKLTEDSQVKAFLTTLNKVAEKNVERAAARLT